MELLTRLLDAFHNAGLVLVLLWLIVLYHLRR